MDISQESVEWSQPLSPVLSSSKNSKKCIKNSKSIKRKAGAKLCERFETEYLVQNERRDDFLNSEAETNTGEQNRKIDINLYKETELSQTSAKIKCSTFDFQTASGKEVMSKSTSSEYANTLFSDIFKPMSLHNRENKFKFLSNKKLSVQTERLTSEDEEFLGFEMEDFISSKRKAEKVQQISDAIYSSKSCLENANKKESWIELDVSESNKKRNLEDYKQMENCEMRQQKKIKKDVKPDISTDTQLHNTSHEIENIRVLNIENIKNPEECISPNEAYVTCLKDKLYGNSENQKNVCKSKQNKQFMFEVSHMFENCIPSKNSNNYIKVQSSTNVVKKKNSDAFIPVEKNTGETSYSFDGKLKQHYFKNSDSDRNSYGDNAKLHSPQATAKSKLQFSTASGGTISTSNTALSKANKILKDIQDLEVPQEDSTVFIEENFPLASMGCTTDIQILKEHTLPNSDSKAKNGQADSSFPDKPQIRTSGFSTASGKEIEIPSASLAKIDHIFKDIADIDDLSKNNNSASFSIASNCITSSKVAGEELKASTSMIQNDEIIHISNLVTPVRDISKRKKLGSSFCRDGKISNAALNRVKSLFGDMNFDDLKLPGFSKIESPSEVCFSTPIGSSRKVATPQFASSYTSTPTRQVRRSVFDKNDSFLNEYTQEHNCPFLIQKPTTGDLTSWDNELKRQTIILKTKMALISKKQEALSVQIYANSTNEENKFPPSILKKKNRINLKHVQNLELQSDCSEKVNNVILQINPQNAVLIHFNGKWLDTATVTTEDGCTLIPTQQGLIGLAEIEPAFCSMPDIKKSLIPGGWIRNHYKWIIWKLASYERFFPSTLGGCFTIDNVIKQLKYRYYRELYCAERPALRKICEMDDIPQKRMVLCISNIFKNGDSIELELTDGWYCIRTLIDEPLCHQINTRKIRIGSKLITSGAELVNCEGCYPLEMEAQKVRLKIKFNSTRRAAWFSKLGYQKNSMPLLIKLRDANHTGGVIGAVKVYIMRTYPLNYMERTKHSVVWRNQNAENKLSQEYENKCFMDYINIVGDGSSSKNADVMNRRTVCPIFQMTVIDVLDDQSKPYKCTVWDVNEFHIQQLKENQITLMYNLTLRCADELSCNKKTRFEIPKEDIVKYIKYKRKYVPLASYDVMLKNSNFGFFDTVGFAVKIRIEEENQYFWLTDLSKNLLLIEINEGPDRCLLLNRIEEDQPVAVCNLSLKKSFQEYVMASAGLNTVVTNYPQYESLREEMEKFKTVDKTELNILLKYVKVRINNLQIGNFTESISHSSTGGDMLNFSRVTSTDIVMSMINIDDVVNNTK